MSIRFAAVRSQIAAILTVAVAAACWVAVWIQMNRTGMLSAVLLGLGVWMAAAPSTVPLLLQPPGSM